MQQQHTSFENNKQFLLFPKMFSTQSEVVKEGSMGRSPKASHTALPRPKCPILPSLEGNMGHFVPYYPPWRVIWDGRPILPSLEGNMGRTSRTRKEGGGEANLVSGRAIWDAFDQNCSKMADFFLAGKRGCGLRLFHSDFRLVSRGLRLFCWIAGKTDFALVSICRIDDEINKSVFRFTDLKVQAHGHKVETSRFQDRHHPMKGSHVHRTQRRFLLITGTGKV